MKLCHLHLPGLTSYLRASAIQEFLVRAFLEQKAAPSNTTPLRPVILTFQTPPTYTCGRREIGNLSESQINHLQAGGKAEFYGALRGGQTTFHGPGQLTAYLILSLQAHNLTPRSHVKLLEDSVIATCAQYRLDTHTNENPGVWIGSYSDDRKLASVGVHLRRHIASHGIGLNISVDLAWFDRIVACGLVGRRATSIERELMMTSREIDETGRTRSKAINPIKNAKSTVIDKHDRPSYHANIPSIPQVAGVFANSVMMRLSGVDETVESILEADIWPG